MKKVLLGLTVWLGLVAPAFAATELTVYTAVETELLGPYKKAFEAKYPDIILTWVRDSTGIITARILGEKDAPKADVVFGLNVTSILVLDQEGLLDTYIPKGVEGIPAFMRDKRASPTWVGMSACPAAICINKKEMEKLGLAVPASWEDLAAPEYKGHIVMSNPSSSGTAYTIVSSWIQEFGTDKAWSFMDALDKNIKVYTHSGAHPAEMAARGETVIGLSEAAFARTLRLRGAPLDIVVLTTPIPLDMEASAIVKGTNNRDAAAKLIDFSISPEMASLVAERDCVSAQPSLNSKEVVTIPQAMGYYDFTKAAGERQSTIESWRAKFDAQ